MMLVKTLQIENFRPFYGMHEIEFSTDEGRNVTLIHGENGVGKTTILNAILWCLFESTTNNFERASELLNHEAESEGKKSFSVSVRFLLEENNGNEEYEIKRGSDFQGKSFFRAFKIINGNFEPVPNPFNLVNSIIHRDMAHYFFFHGEGISSVEERHVMRDAIRDVLGLSVAEMALEDLKTIEKRVRREVAKESPDTNLEDIEYRITRGEESINEKGKKAIEFKEHIRRKEDQIEQLDSELRDLPNASDLQIRRERAENQVKIWRNKDLEYEIDKADFLEKKGWSIFGKGLIDESLSFIEEQGHKGTIPKPYNETFVKDLLARQECVCGRPLKEHTDEWRRIQDLLNKAGNALLENRVARARGKISEVKRLLHECPEGIRLIERRQADARNNLRDQEQDLKELSDRLGKIDVDNVNKKEVARRQFRDEIKVSHGKLTKIEDEVSALKNNVDGFMRERNTIAAKEKRVGRLEHKRMFCQELANRLEKEIDDQENRAIKTIVNNVNNTLEEFSRKSYQARFDTENFRLNLIRKDDRPVAKSTGEKLLLNLSFISTLIWYCVERRNASGKILLPGASAPFIIDAPFGDLDDTYKGATARFLPNRSRQVVLLLSSSHWQGTVDDNIRDRVGAEYYIVSETTDISGPDDRITIRGKEIKQAVYGAERDLSRIERVDW